MGVLRGPDEPHAWRVLVDQEDGRLGGVAVDVGVHQEEVGDVAARHVPLLALEHPSVAVAPSGRRDHRHIRPGTLLGDRVRVPPFTPARRPQEPLLLLLGPRGERDRGTPRDVPEGVRDAAPLLLDEHHLEGVEALAAVLDGVVDRREPVVDHRLLRRRRAPRGQAVVLLTLELQWLQGLVGEAPRPGLQGGVVWSKLQFHRHPWASCSREHRGGPHAPVRRWRVGRGRR